jgi:hypothetical protein
VKLVLLLLICIIQFSCKRRPMESSERYGVPSGVSESRSIFEFLNRPNASLKVCLYNEDPESKLGKLYLDFLEEDFREGLYKWLEVAAEHPSWVGPSRPKLHFVRINFDEYRRWLVEFRKSVDPKIFAKIRALLTENHETLDEAWGRYKKIVSESNLQKIAAPAYKFGCRNAVSIYGFTSKDKAVAATYLIASNGDLMFLPDDHLQSQIVNLFLNLEIENQPNEKEKIRIREHEVQRRLKTWNRAWVDMNGPSIIVGLRNYTEDVAESVDPMSALMNSSRFEDKWIMNHEIGHLFFLQDVYIKGKEPSALNRHPTALMGEHVKARGEIQADDKAGLFSVIDGLKSGKITRCVEGYKPLDNSIDDRSEGNLYCIPNERFINQVDMPRPRFLPQ